MNGVLLLLVTVFVSYSLMMSSNGIAYAAIPQEDLNEFYKAQENFKTFGDLTESCQVEEGEDLSTFHDCIRIIKSFNLKMDDLRSEYGAILDKYIHGLIPNKILFL